MCVCVCVCCYITACCLFVVCVLQLETKNDLQVTKMTQKFEFIATRKIEKPAMKSSTYYASIGREPDHGGRTTGPHSTPVTDAVDSFTGSWNRPAESRVMKEEKKTDSDDKIIVAETVDRVSLPPVKRDKLSEKFRKWQEDESKLYSDTDYSPRSPGSTSTASDTWSQQTVEELVDVGPNIVLGPDETRADTDGELTSRDVAAEEREGEPVTRNSHIPEPETLDLTDDILQRNLVDDGRTDESDTFEDTIVKSSKAVDVKDNDQDVDLSQMVESNWPDGKIQEIPSESQPISKEPSNVDRMERRISLSSSRGVVREVPCDSRLSSKEQDIPCDSELVAKEPSTVDRIERRVSLSTSRAVVPNLHCLQNEPLITDGKVFDRSESENLLLVTDSEPDLNTQPGPVAETVFGGETTEPQECLVRPHSQTLTEDAGDSLVLDTRLEPQELAIRPHQLQYEEELQRMARDADALQQEVDTTVNSRELETTDEIVVETKVTETKTVLMHLGESGNISVMETTEVKTDTDMKETKKILERDEVAVSHRSSRSDFSPFIPLSPSPSPAGSLRSKTPDRQSPSGSLKASDSVEKLTEADLAEDRAALGDARPEVGVDAGLYVAICPYDPETDDVMSLHEGEFLEVLEDTAVDWWLVKKSFDGREGYVPAQYLRDKQTDDRMIEEELAKQMDKIDFDSSKEVLSAFSAEYFSL